MSIIEFIVAFIAIVFVSNCIHECGHAVGARWCNYQNVVISIGSGKKLFSFQLLTIEWNVCMLFFIGGQTSYESRDSFQPLDIVLISMMGPLCNGIIAYMLLLGTDMFAHSMLYMFFLFNVWLTIGNGIPIKWKDKASDGYLALKMIVEHVVNQSKD